MLRQPRPVHARTILELVRRRSMFLKLGGIFAIVGIFMSLIFFTFLSTLDDGEQKIDYPTVYKNGHEATAVITNIETQYNVSINHQHPSIITYRYEATGKSTEAKFTTLAPDAVARMQVGDSIPIKHLNGQSAITNLEPFAFPFMIFYIVPLIFLLMGVPCVLLLIKQTLRDIHIVKYGTIADAEVISITHKPGTSKRRATLRIHYQYNTSRHGAMLADDITTDMSMLNTLRQGDIVKIFVSPEDESKSILISRLEAVRNNWAI
jgi:hypothetical protein